MKQLGTNMATTREKRKKVPQKWPLKLLTPYQPQGQLCRSVVAYKVTPLSLYPYSENIFCKRSIYNSWVDMLK